MNNVCKKILQTFSLKIILEIKYAYAPQMALDDDSYSKLSAAISVAFNRNSPWNLATPSKFFASTKILEIKAIILGLKQSTRHNINRVHITVNNLCTLKFLRETVTLSRDSSTYLQEKIEYNSYFEVSYT